MSSGVDTAADRTGTAGKKTGMMQGTAGIWESSMASNSELKFGQQDLVQSNLAPNNNRSVYNDVQRQINEKDEV